MERISFSLPKFEGVPLDKMYDLPLYVYFLFGLTALLTIILFFLATKSKTALFIILLWGIVQSALSIGGFYKVTDTMPPRMLFGLLPTILLIIYVLSSKRCKTFNDSVNIKSITWLHTIRIPVEISLALLFHYGVMSQYITYEGTNFDIISGVTAPLMVLLAFRHGTINRKLLLVWNFICLGLLLNVVITAIFCIPSPLQQLAFDQPNVAVLRFPFLLLPTIVVPIVLYSHLVVIRNLLRKTN